MEMEKEKDSSKLPAELAVENYPYSEKNEQLVKKRLLEQDPKVCRKNPVYQRRGGHVLLCH
ncbi:hypothetical protein [Paenibacillus helianthi]|uniref:hypothetical protein n=1 Tax=Paenibacillus helianthi TaxID=1349432 RepID=UPI000A569FDD|nr:hypothetical protein [Paenibacillus helianthi]